MHSINQIHQAYRSEAVAKRRKRTPAWPAGLLIPVQIRRPAGRIAVDQTPRTPDVEAMHPISQGLAVHGAKPSRLRPRTIFGDRRQGQQALDLLGVLRTTRQSPKITRRVIRTRWNP